METLAQSGEWFRKKYKTTPATSVTVLDDLPGSNQKTVWFNSRFYRANLNWDNGALRFRDIHLFDENLASSYLTEKGTSNQCIYYTLPFVDGYFWSSRETTAGLWFKAEKDGEQILLEGAELSTAHSENETLNVVWKLDDGSGTFTISLNEKNTKVTFDGNRDIKWYLALDVAENAELPFTSVEAQKAEMSFENIDYKVEAGKGNFVVHRESKLFRILPDKNEIVLNFSGKL
ncbi:MAG: hypothetical protein ACK5M7_11750 [Draconibacterium sp.]